MRLKTRGACRRPTGSERRRLSQGRVEGSRASRGPWGPLSHLEGLGSGQLQAAPLLLSSARCLTARCVPALLCGALNPAELPLWLRRSSMAPRGCSPHPRSEDLLRVALLSFCHAPHCLGHPALPCPPCDVPLTLQAQLKWEKPFLAPSGRSGSFRNSALLRPSPKAGCYVICFFCKELLKARTCVCPSLPGRS